MRSLYDEDVDQRMTHYFYPDELYANNGCLPKAVNCNLHFEILLFSSPCILAKVTTRIKGYLYIDSQSIIAIFVL
ncbi:hypothetical protein, partial [Bacteroides sp. 51]|uniref:hypothetical protein n=1 Tax=Bacteroides sp. 51 TaxID=2302938 RepID=UPI0019403008